jgi:galactokinase
VNLIGEHIDYHMLSVLPMAIQRRIRLRFRSSENSEVRAESEVFGERSIRLDEKLELGAAGDWVNYLKAAVRIVRGNWDIRTGFEGVVMSDLPTAAGLSSSSSLLTAFALALLQVNEKSATLEDLMGVLPEGEQFVGTRGGGMDHATVLAGRRGCALHVRFAPFEVRPVPIPRGWKFLIAHSLVRAEKSGAARARYNACREAGLSALRKLGLDDFRTARLEAADSPNLTGEEGDAYLHVVTEAQRVDDAICAMQRADFAHFGELLNESHKSLRDRLRVSNPALDTLTEIALEAGAQGARLTGAGFGGCVLMLCTEATQSRVAAALRERFYAQRIESLLDDVLFEAIASDGALLEGAIYGAN